MNNLFFSLPILSSAANSAMAQALQSALTIMLVLAALVLVIAVVLEVMRHRTPNRNQRQLLRVLTIPVYLVAAVVLGFAVFCGVRLGKMDDIHMEQPSSSTTVPSAPESTGTSLPPEPTQPPKPTEPKLPETPHKTDKSNPANWDIKWEINVNGSFVNNYTRPQTIHFGLG